MTVPDLRNLTGAIVMELVDANGKRIAANFVNIVVRPTAQQGPHGQPSPRMESRGCAAGRRCGSAPTRSQRCPGMAWGRTISGRHGKFWGQGSGTVEYRFEIPEAVLKAQPQKIQLIAELATKAGTEKLDWPNRRIETDYPQTDGKKFPGRRGCEPWEASNWNRSNWRTIRPTRAECFPTKLIFITAVTAIWRSGSWI